MKIQTRYSTLKKNGQILLKKTETNSYLIRKFFYSIVARVYLILNIYEDTNQIFNTQKNGQILLKKTETNRYLIRKV